MEHYNKGDGVQNPFLDPDIQPKTNPTATARPMKSFPTPHGVF
jgi:hypothetical protein